MRAASSEAVSAFVEGFTAPRPDAAPGSPPHRRRTPRPRRAATRARRSGRPRGRHAGWTRTPAAAPGAPASGTVSDFSSTRLGDQHQPLGGPRHEAVVGGERRRGDQVRVHDRGQQQGRRRGRAAEQPGHPLEPFGGARVARPPQLRRPAPCRRRRGCAAGPAPAAATDGGSARARAAPADTRTRVARDLVALPRPHLGQRGGRALEHRARVGAPQQRLGGRLRRRTAQPAVAQHRVDAVAGGGERRRHPFQRLQPGKGVVGMAHGRKAIQPGNLDGDEHRPARAGPFLRRRRRGLRPRPADLPPRGSRLADLRPAPHRARARRGHRQAHRAAGGAGPRRARDRPRPADARAAREEPPRRARLPGAGRGDPLRRRVLRRRGVRPGLPLVRRRPRAARDRPRAQAPRPPLPGLEPARRADPVGQAAGRASSAPRTSCATRPRS